MLYNNIFYFFKCGHANIEGKSEQTLNFILYEQT